MTLVLYVAGRYREPDRADIDRMEPNSNDRYWPRPCKNTGSGGYADVGLFSRSPRGHVSAWSVGLSRAVGSGGFGFRDASDEPRRPPTGLQAFIAVISALLPSSFSTRLKL